MGTSPIPEGGLGRADRIGGKLSTLHLAGLTGAFLAGVGWLFVLFRDLRHDDAFITFQYARNVATGQGWVFDAGERVMGTTSPLQTLLLAGGWWLAGDGLPTIANFLGAVAVGCQALLLYLLVRDSARVAAAILGLVAMAGLNDSAAWLPLETSLMSALVLASVWTMRAGRESLCGIALGLAFLCRYEAALLTPVLVVQRMTKTRRVPWTTLAVALAVVTPWLIFAHVYFGSISPHTLAAKSGLTPSGEYLARFARRALAYPWRALRDAGQIGPGLLWTSALLWLSGAAFILAHARQLLPLLVHALGLLVAYAWIGPLWNEAWHHNLPLLACNTMFVLGWAGWADRLAVGRETFALRAGLALAGIALVASWGAHTYRFSAAYPSLIWWGLRHDRYVGVSAWVNENARSDATFMANEFGTLGYLTKRPMIDTVGLINWTNDYPKHRSTGEHAALVKHYQPGLVLVDTGLQGLLLERATGYRVVRHFDWDVYGSTLLVRDPEVLAHPERFDDYRAAVPHDLASRPRGIAYEPP
jgi:hypothetical protein